MVAVFSVLRLSCTTWYVAFADLQFIWLGALLGKAKPEYGTK